MDVFTFYALVILAVTVVLLVAIAVAVRRGWHRTFLSDRELMQVGKIVFVAGAVMAMIAVRVAADVPAGQLIYGRF